MLLARPIPPFTHSPRPQRHDLTPPRVLLATVNDGGLVLTVQRRVAQPEPPTAPPPYNKLIVITISVSLI